MRADKNAEIYQFKVTLIGVTPPIWRRVQLEAGCTLAQFHRVLQIAMGWENTRLSAILPSAGTTLTYIYDLGGGWEHELLLEVIVMPSSDVIYPRCLAGERNCPPEDAGASVPIRFTWRRWPIRTMKSMKR